MYEHARGDEDGPLQPETGIKLSCFGYYNNKLLIAIIRKQKKKSPDKLVLMQICTFYNKTKTREGILKMKVRFVKFKICPASASNQFIG